MSQKMTVALSEIKYIQSEIEKILNFHKNSSPTQKNTEQRYMKETLSSGTKKDLDSPRMFKRKTIIPPMSPNKFGKNRKSTGSEEMKKKVECFSPTPNISKKKKDPEKVSQKSQKNKKKKEESEDKIKMKTQNTIAPEGFAIKLSKIDQIYNQSPQPEVQISSNLPRKPGKLTQNASNSSLMRKWTIHQRSSDKGEKVQTPIQRNITIDMSKVCREVESRTPDKSRKQSVPKSCQSLERISKKSKSIDKHSTSYIYSVPKQQKVPYHLNSKNKTPLRTDDKYLSQRYAIKPVQKENNRQQNLKMKYHVLDQRLQKIKGNFQTMIQCQNIGKEKNEGKLDHRSKKSLLKYMRYSPLRKLVRINEKFKIEHKRSLSQDYRRTKEDIRKEKQRKIGRPLWET